MIKLLFYTTTAGKTVLMDSITNSVTTEQMLIFKSPLTGCLVPIEEIPDPVFSQKLVGDGISIDPLDSILRAPVSGTVAHIHSCGHAITLLTREKIEVLIHIGIDTVNLKGQGFKTIVKVGDNVVAGDALIEFDADYIALNAKSLLTQILVTNAEGLRIEKKSASQIVHAGRDIIFSVHLENKNKADKSLTSSSNFVNSSPLLEILNPTGFHARPCAVFVAAAKKFQSQIELKCGERVANGKSIVSIMGLEISYGDKILILAEGPDSSEAIKELVFQVNNGLGEKFSSKPVEKNIVHQNTNTEIINTVMPEKDTNVLAGVSASPGIAVGQVYHIQCQEIEVPDSDGYISFEESSKMTKAIEKAKIELQALRSKLASQSDSEKAAIFAAHEELLEDPALFEVALKELEKGKSAAFAWKKAYSVNANHLANLKNELLAARANDLRDVGQRVLGFLTDSSSSALITSTIPANSILIAESLTPSDTANLDRSKVLGFCTTTGGATSHVAILARSLGIPAIAGIESRALNLPSGTMVVLDGTQGFLKINPESDEIKKIQTLQKQYEQQKQLDLIHAHEPCATSDGHKVEVFANISGLVEAEKAMTLGGEGVGLLRSEFLFQKRMQAPNEEEQFEVYHNIAQALKFKNPLTIRTLDVGGDKPLPYLPLPAEENPFLGVRGIRVSLNHQEMFREQLRAILRAAQGDQIRIMFPMITSLSEFIQAKSILEEERIRLNLQPVSAGIMIEVPAAAVMADVLAKEVDFFSIGTNDLTQYTLAMDRGHAQLASQADGLHPSVLRLIDITVKAAHRHNKWVGVCGGIASDADAVPILVGLGVDELSVSVPSIPGIKSQIRKLNYGSCQELAKQALEKATATDVRSMLKGRL
ncbi:MAG: phosphoenolpyruvate--protein phosphotransferase [Bdellovibrio sp.]